MPSDPTAEQVEIRRKGRQRLIGAVALALVAVVFVPMLLDPEPRRERVEPELAIPPKDSIVSSVQAPVSRRPDATRPREPAPAEATTTKAAATAAPPVAAVEATPAQAKKPVEPKTPEFKPPAARPTAAASKAEMPAPRLEGFAVQVGAFKDDAKLAQARERIAAARLAHYTERLDGSSGELTRLRAGPFPTREAAERAAAQLKRAGLEARVVTLP